MQVEDQVTRGEAFGYSGNSGSSSYPHLHFFVQQIIEECHDAGAKTADLALCPQVPISFSHASPGDTVLRERVEVFELIEQGQKNGREEINVSASEGSNMKLFVKFVLRSKIRFSVEPCIAAVFWLML